MDLSPLMAELAAALDAPHDPLRSAAGVLLERLAVDRVSISSIDRAAGAFEVLASAGEPCSSRCTRLPLTTLHPLSSTPRRAARSPPPASTPTRTSRGRSTMSSVRRDSWRAAPSRVRRGDEGSSGRSRSPAGEDPGLPGKAETLGGRRRHGGLLLGRRPPGRGPGVLILHQDPLTAGARPAARAGGAGAGPRPPHLGAAVAPSKRGESPEVLVCDAWLDGIPVDEAVAAWRRAGTAAPVLVVAAHDTPQNLEAAVRAGAAAYLARPQTVDALALAVSTLQDGRTLLPKRAGVTLDRRDRLTPREREVLAALDEGLRTKQVALRLGLSEDTVKSHTRSVFRKLDVSSRAEALHAARLQGLLG
jgi:DNA-binding NarL/FixJ family response regulator